MKLATVITLILTSLIFSGIAYMMPIRTYDYNIAFWDDSYVYWNQKYEAAKAGKWTPSSANYYYQLMKNAEWWRDIGTNFFTAILLSICVAGVVIPTVLAEKGLK